MRPTLMWLRVRLGFGSRSPHSSLVVRASILIILTIFTIPTILIILTRLSQGEHAAVLSVLDLSVVEGLVRGSHDDRGRVEVWLADRERDNLGLGLGVGVRQSWCWCWGWG